MRAMPQFVAPTLVTRSLAETRAFLAGNGEIIVKPLHGNGGKAIFKVGRDGANLSSLIEVFKTAYREPHMIQAFPPEVAQGEKRNVPVDGEVAGENNRRPGRGEMRAHRAAGGEGEKGRRTPREREMADEAGPVRQ